MPYLSVADYVASAGDQLLPQTAKTIIMASGYLVAGAAAAGDTTIDIDGSSTAGVPDEAAFFFGTANGNVYRADGAVAAGATDATVLTVTLDRGLAASVADNAAVVNVPTDRITDTARIQIHITDAHGVCRTYLPAALMDTAGAEVALADLSITLREKYCRESSPTSAATVWPPERLPRKRTWTATTRPSRSWSNCAGRWTRIPAARVLWQSRCGHRCSAATKSGCRDCPTRTYRRDSDRSLRERILCDVSGDQDRMMAEGDGR